MSRADRSGGSMGATSVDRFRWSAGHRTMAFGFHAIEDPAADRVRVYTESRERHGRPRN